MNENLTGNFSPVYYGKGKLDAETVSLFLQSFGIKAFVAQESAGTTLGLTVGTLGRAIVYVPEKSAPEAINLLHEMEEGYFIESNNSGEDKLADENE